MTVDIRAFSHVVMPVSDLDRSVAFYRDTLGLEVVMRIDPDDPDAQGGLASGLRIAGLLVPGGTMLELAEGMPGSIGSSDTVALGVDDVHAAAKALEAAGVEIRMPPTEVMPGVTMMFVPDPDGRNVELVEFASGAVTSHENLRRTAGVT